MTITTLALIIPVYLIGCSSGEQEMEPKPKPAPESFAGYHQVPMEGEELDQLIDNITGVLGHTYTWGGDSITNGFDCSGLIQWGFRKAGYNRFRNDEAVYHEIAAHELYQYNVIALDGLDQMRRGYFIFFDQNGDGRITHNAVFDRVDESGQVWVFDAFSTLGVVAHRPVEDFWNKGPLFGKPLKTIRR